MAKSFHFSLGHQPDELLARLKQLVARGEWYWSGDASAGRLAGQGFEAHYQVADGKLAVTVLRKPFWIPWQLVQMTLSDHLE